MKFSKGTTVVLLSSLLSISIISVSFAQLRNDSNDVFTTPKRGGWTQILLGLVELNVAKAVWPGMEFEEGALKTSQDNLKAAQELPTSDAKKRAIIEEIMVDSDNYENGERTGRTADLDDDARRMIARARAVEIVTEAEKVQRIAIASEEVAKATEVALKAAQGRGFVHHGVRILRAGTSIILAGDALARVYIWNVLDANPGFAPLATMTIEGVQNILDN